MTLPLFLRPLLLIDHYWQLLVYRINRWLQRSNDELFGPLEQIIVAVVITGIAMNPSLIHLGRPMPTGVPFPLTVQAPPAIPAMPAPRPPPQPPQPPHPPAIPDLPSGADVAVPSLLSASLNSTSPTAPQTVDTGYTWLDLILNLLPPVLRPNPMTVASTLMLINLTWLIAPSDLVRRLKESWQIFWPPWQDRSHPSTPPARSRDRPAARDRAASQYYGSGRVTGQDTAGSQVKSKAREEIEGGSRAEKPAGSDTIEAKANDGTQAEAHDKQYHNGATKATDVKAKFTPGRETRAEVKTTKGGDDERAKDEEKAKRRALAEYEAKKQAADVAVERNTAESETPEHKGLPKSCQNTDDALAASRQDDPTSPGSQDVVDDSDPLMAGDYRPLRSILKKSTKKTRQTKNIHHNYFMGMRGHQAHLIPFPHGLHPPPTEPRHTMWWRNIPKDATHLMAPPLPPKVVREDQDTEEEVAKVKVKGKEIEGAKSDQAVTAKATESEMRAKMKEKEAEKQKREGTATATAKVEQPSEPIVPVDPQVQKATWASRALLCLLLFHIQQQLGLMGLAFFVWQQLNAHAAAEETRRHGQPVAIATAEAEVQPRPQSEDEAIPTGMKEKLQHAEQEKARSPTDGNKMRERSKVEEAKPRGDAGGAAEAKIRERMEMMPPDDRKKYEAYLEQRKRKEQEYRPPRPLSKDEKEAYLKRGEGKLSWDDQQDPSLKSGNAGSEDVKKKQRAEETEEVLEPEKTMSKSRTWHDLTDEEKKRYLKEREKRKQAQAKASNGKGEGSSGLTADEKAEL